MKYIIVYDDTYNLHYYCRFVFNSEKHWWMLTSRNLKDVRPYDTRKDAQDEIDRYDPDLSEHDILAIPNKDLFIARLKG